MAAPLPPFATCPQEGRILEYYRGTFEAAYVLLSPFIRAGAIETKRFFSMLDRVTRAEVCQNCMPVSWREVMEATGLPSIEAVGLGLLTSIGALKKDYSNQHYASAIEFFTKENQVVEPGEGSFPELLLEPVLEAIRVQGYESLYVGDEFGEERKLHSVDDLLDIHKELPQLGVGTRNIYTPDHEILWTVHWDSHYSLLCSSEDKLRTILRAHDFEGFFCTDSTEIHWPVLRGSIE